MDPGLDCDLPPVQHRQRSLPRTPREMEVLGETLGVELLDKGRVISPRPSPRRTASHRIQQTRSAIVGGPGPSRPSGDQTHLEQSGGSSGTGVGTALPARRIFSGGVEEHSHQAPSIWGASPHPHSSTTDQHHKHKSSYRSNQGSNNNNSSDSHQAAQPSGKENYRRRRHGEGVLRTRVTRQSPVEERLSVHEDEAGGSDAFDDDGLFQIDENFAKFLDDKTSCQK